MTGSAHRTIPRVPKPNVVGRKKRSILGCQVRALTREEAGGEDRVLEFIASTEEVATDGLILLASGWDVDRFLRAGSFLWAHNMREDKPPIGVPISAEVDEEAKALRVRVRVAAAEDFPFADRVYRLYKAGILRTVSVGFRVVEMRDPIPSETERGAWGVSTNHELFELSAVPVPADSGAQLVHATRAAIDGGQITLEDVESVTKAARTVARRDTRAAGARAWVQLLEVLRRGDEDEEEDEEEEVPPPPADEEEEETDDEDDRDRIAANADALRDIAQTWRQGADMLDAIAEDLVKADEPEDEEDPVDEEEPDDEEDAGEEAKANLAATVRSAVEAAVRPLVERLTVREARVNKRTHDKGHQLKNVLAALRS